MATLALPIAMVVAGCSSGGGATNGAAHTSPTPVKPLHVRSVAPDRLTGTTPIVVTFRAPLPADSALPTLHPKVAGQWTRSGSTATFTPAQAYPPDTTFTLRLVRKPGAHPKQIAQPRSTHGSVRFAQQILARLHYLPLNTKAAPPADAAGEAAAVYDPPTGRFTWRYHNTPAALREHWKPGKAGTVTRGAVIAFQHHAHLKTDGVIGHKTWHALLRADLAHDVDPDHYSYVSANLYLPQRLSVWVDGHTVLTSPVNGGVAAAPTPLGTFPVYLRYTSTTMKGTNPDGTTYDDPGVPWVNYFSGGSAVHGFPRASYGSPQSVGCLELPISTAEHVYDLIDYGTLVTVAGPYVAPPPVAEPSPPHTAKPQPKPTSTHAAPSHPKPSATASPTQHGSPQPTATTAPNRRHARHE